MLERMKQYQKVKLSKDENEVVEHTQAQKLSSQILAKLATIYPIEFSPDEINYLALRIANLLQIHKQPHVFKRNLAHLLII